MDPSQDALAPGSTDIPASGVVSSQEEGEVGEVLRCERFFPFAFRGLLDKECFVKILNLLAQVHIGEPVLEVLPLRIHRGRLVISGFAWAEYSSHVQNASFADFWLYCCQYFANNSYGLEHDFERRDRFALATVAEEGSPRYSTGFRVAETRDFNFSYAYELFDPLGINRNYVVEFFFF